MYSEEISFLKEELGLDLHMGKLHIVDVNIGVEFLGAFVRKFRTYVSRASLGRSVTSIINIDTGDKSKLWRSINSFVGMMAHYTSYYVRCRVFLRNDFLSLATFDKDVTKMNKPLFINI